jgi:hypothetical protein
MSWLDECPGGGLGMTAPDGTVMRLSKIDIKHVTKGAEKDHFWSAEIYWEWEGGRKKSTKEIVPRGYSMGKKVIMDGTKIMRDVNGKPSLAKGTNLFHLLSSFEKPVDFKLTTSATGKVTTELVPNGKTGIDPKIMENNGGNPNVVLDLANLVGLEIIATECTKVENDKIKYQKSDDGREFQDTWNLCGGVVKQPTGGSTTSAAATADDQKVVDALTKFMQEHIFDIDPKTNQPVVKDGKWYPIQVLDQVCKTNNYMFGSMSWAAKNLPELGKWFLKDGMHIALK